MPNERESEGGKRERSEVLTVSVLLLLGLPCLYIFALGPLIWLEERGYLPQIVSTGIEGLYAPLFYIVERNAMLRDLYDTWYSWWQ